MTEQLLLHHFATVDLVEPSQNLIGTKPCFKHLKMMP